MGDIVLAKHRVHVTGMIKTQWVSRIQADRLVGLLQRLAEVLAAFIRLEVHDIAPSSGGRHRECRGERRIGVVDTIELLDRRFQSLLGRRIVGSKAALIAPPDIQALEWLPLGAIAFNIAYLRRNCRNDLFGNLVLYREDIFQNTVVAFRPQMIACFSVDQLPGHPYPLSPPSNAPFDDVADAEIAGNRSHIG